MSPALAAGFLTTVPPGKSRSLCILDNNALSDVSLANIFSHSVACVLIPLTLFLIEQKFFILMKSSLSILSFMDRAFGVVSKKELPYPRSSRFFPALSSRSFVVLHFTFRSVIDFALIFVKGVKSVSRSIFFFLHVDVQLF